MTEIERSKCGNCGKIFKDRKNKRNGHSQKDFMRCLYTINTNMYGLILKYKEQQKQLLGDTEEKKEEETTPQEDAKVLLESEKNWKDEKKEHQSIATEETKDVVEKKK